MTRQMTVPVPPARRILGWVLAVVAVVVLVVAGLRVGAWLTSPGPAAEFTGGAELQQVQTIGGTYVGQVVSDRDGYVRLADPAIVRAEPAPSGQTEGQIVVQMLGTEPYGVAGDLLLPREQIVAISNVASDANLFAAYRQATGEAP